MLQGVQSGGHGTSLGGTDHGPKTLIPGEALGLGKLSRLAGPNGLNVGRIVNLLDLACRQRIRGEQIKGLDWRGDQGVGNPPGFAGRVKGVARANVVGAEVEVHGLLSRPQPSNEVR